jgi:hypothetical protein
LGRVEWILTLGRAGKAMGDELGKNDGMGGSAEKALLFIASGLAAK